jgi:hypothetical protein
MHWHTYVIIVGVMELFEEFVFFITNRPPHDSTIYWDLTVVVSLVAKGGGVTRTKHFRPRINLALEEINEKIFTWRKNLCGIHS